MTYVPFDWTGMPGPESSVSARLEWGINNGPLHFRPLCYAAINFGAILAMLPPSKKPFRAPTSRPVILIVGDDLDTALGPDGFNKRALRTYIARCRGAVIVSSAATVESYTAAATPSALGADMLLIETRVEQEIPWIKFVRDASPDINILLSTVKGGQA